MPEGLSVCMCRAVRRSNCFHMHEADLAAANADGDGASSLCQVPTLILGLTYNPKSCVTAWDRSFHDFLYLPFLVSAQTHALTHFNPTSTLIPLLAQPSACQTLLTKVLMLACPTFSALFILQHSAVVHHCTCSHWSCGYERP